MHSINSESNLFQANNVFLFYLLSDTCITEFHCIFSKTYTEKISDSDTIICLQSLFLDAKRSELTFMIYN